MAQGDTQATKAAEGAIPVPYGQLFKTGMGAVGDYLGFSAARGSAAKARQFTERMTRNKYTYMVEDLRRAGINPLLMMGSAGAQGASSPPAQTPDFQGGVKANIASALLVKQGRLIDAQTNKTIQESKILSPKGTIYGTIDDLLNNAKAGSGSLWDVMKDTFFKDLGTAKKVSEQEKIDKATGGKPIHIYPEKGN